MRKGSLALLFDSLENHKILYLEGLRFLMEDLLVYEILIFIKIIAYIYGFRNVIYLNHLTKSADP